MKAKKLLAVGSLAALTAVGLAACGNKSDKLASDQVLKWSYQSELPSMDPSKATDTISFDQMANSMEGLYRLGKDSKVTPGLAKSTKVSDDGLTYTFKLRKSTWSNGDPVTAKDFVYSWQRTVDPKTASEYSYLFSGIKNADAIIDGKKPVTDLGVKAVGDDKLVVTLEKDIPYFKLLMGFPLFFPQSQKAVEKYGDKYGTAAKYMTYNGPFKMTGWTGTNLKWKLEKNDKYWDKDNVKLSAIEFQVNKSTNTSYNLYQSNKLDYTFLSTEQAKQLNKQDGYHILKEARTNYLQYNVAKNKFLANQKIRQAISHAINRETLAANILGSGTLPSSSIVSKGLATYDGKDFVQVADSKANKLDKKEAQRLLKEGLQEVGEDKLTLNLLGDDTDVAKKVTEFVQSQLETNLGNGTKITVQNVPFKTRLSRVSGGDFDMAAVAWGADFADPISFLDLFTSDNSYNTGKWNNAEYDKLITASKTTDANNAKKRFNDLVKASDVLNEDQGATPLFQLNQAYMLRPGVKGLIQNSAGVTNNWKNVYISK